MVDINLIGDDKTGEEERVEDFTQTSSMDTQELAFEERTETFDTTKTAGFAHKRSYSSLVSTLIILAVIILLGGAIYFFMFSEDEVGEQAEIPSFTPESQDVVETVPATDLDKLEQEFAAELAEEESQEPEITQPVESTDEPVSEPPRRSVAETPPTPAPTVRSDLSPVSSQFLSNSRGAIQSVTDLMTSIPSNLNTTLLSYAGERVRVEFVANTVSEAKDFTNSLNQTFGGSNFSVVSENQVASNGRSLEKVLVSGKMTTDGRVSSSESMQFLNLGQAQDWIRRASQQFGLTVRELKTQQGTFVDGYQRIPLLVRVYGNQSSIVGFLEEIAAQSLNVELAKILLVSPDMVSYSDDNLILVINMYLYEQT